MRRSRHNTAAIKNWDARLSARPNNLLSSSKSNDLGQLDVLGARALRSAAFGIRHFLTFLQVVELNALKTLGMEEQILFRRRLDEPEAFVGQLLDSAFGHEHAYHSENLNCAVRPCDRRLVAVLDPRNVFDLRENYEAVIRLNFALSGFARRKRRHLPEFTSILRLNYEARRDLAGPGASANRCETAARPLVSYVFDVPNSRYGADHVHDRIPTRTASHGR